MFDSRCFSKFRHQFIRSSVAERSYVDLAAVLRAAYWSLISVAMASGGNDWPNYCLDNGLLSGVNIIVAVPHLGFTWLEVHFFIGGGTGMSLLSQYFLNVVLIAWLVTIGPSYDWGHNSLILVINGLALASLLFGLIIISEFMDWHGIGAAMLMLASEWSLHLLIRILVGKDKVITACHRVIKKLNFGKNRWVSEINLTKVTC